MRAAVREGRRLETVTPSFGALRSPREGPPQVTGGLPSGSHCHGPAEGQAASQDVMEMAVKLPLDISWERWGWTSQDRGKRSA